MKQVVSRELFQDNLFQELMLLFNDSAVYFLELLLYVDAIELKMLITFLVVIMLTSFRFMSSSRECFQSSRNLHVLEAFSILFSF